MADVEVWGLDLGRPKKRCSDLGCEDAWFGDGMNAHG